MKIRDIENYAEKILKKTDQNEPPIELEKIAEKLNLKVGPADLGEEVSGVIFIKNKKGKIGYNPSDIRERIRFTIAHEIGHFVLHKEKMEMFIDKTYYALRDKNSSKGEYKMEREANAFAAALLMPRSLLIREIKETNFDLAEEDSLNKLARKFGVSTQAMSFRLANLNIFKG